MWILDLFTEGVASHLRAALAVIIPPNGELAAAGRSSIHPLLHPPASWCQSRIYSHICCSAAAAAAALSELGARLENVILEYVILRHSLCRRANCLRPENSGGCQHAARISVVRGSTRRCSPYLKAPCCKKLFKRRRSLQLHAMLLPVPHTAQASCSATAHCAAAACCCWHRELQWRLEKANLEIFILQGSSHSL